MHLLVVDIVGVSEDKAVDIMDAEARSSSSGPVAIDPEALRGLMLGFLSGLDLISLLR